MKQRKFIVTIRAQTKVDVYDIQEAVVEAAYPYGDGVGHGDVDVELVEVDENPQHGSGVKKIGYRLIEAA